MSQRDYHVTRRSDGRWQYKQQGAKRASGVERTQNQAEQAAKQLAKKNNHGGEITIHRPNGQIRDRDTIAPANDPVRSRDTRY